MGDYIGGFVLLALQPKRLRIDRNRLLEFARLASFHVCAEVMEKNLSSRVDKLEKERDELVSRLELYNFERIYEADFSAVLKHIAAHTGIASAVVAGPNNRYEGVVTLDTLIDTITRLRAEAEASTGAGDPS